MLIILKFFAILSLNTQFRPVRLTPALSCIHSTSGGRDHDELYRAFSAASVLQARILRDIPPLAMAGGGHFAVFVHYSLVGEKVSLARLQKWGGSV